MFVRQSVTVSLIIALPVSSFRNQNSQAVGLPTGNAKEFSWKNVGLAALGGAVTAGVGQMTGAPGSESIYGISKAMDPYLYGQRRDHHLRHTRASLVQNGTPLYDIQEIDGWKSSEMVRRYAH